MLGTRRLLLEPLAVGHADEMAPVLDDPALHVFTGGAPLTPGRLRARYRRLELGRSADGSQRWLNWIVRLCADRQAIGATQATVTADDDRVIARLAWTIGVRHQRQGYATEAARAMATWLRQEGVDVLLADIRPGHVASIKVARAVGLAPTGQVPDGEIRWIG